MDVVKYKFEFAQNAFGNQTGNRAKTLGIYKCKQCGDEITIWSDHNRLPVCMVCEDKVEWEKVGDEVDDVSQAGR